VARNISATLQSPKFCPHCRKKGQLLALGYYYRFISGLNRDSLELPIRRFRCAHCGHTVSLLPDFAQPYRLVRNSTVEAYFDNRIWEPGSHRWASLLEQYWRRYVCWVPNLVRYAGNYPGLDPPLHDPQQCWVLFLSVGGSLEKTTLSLVSRHQVTMFNKYQCHTPCSPTGKLS